MLTKVLVVGGAGYIGGSVTDQLLKYKVPFTVFDNLTYDNQYLKPVPFIYGDVRDRKKLRSLFPEYSHVIWLSAIVGDKACDINKKITVDINDLSVKWLSKNFTGKIIFTSTCSVYGASKDPVAEESATQPLSLYASTKLKAESYLIDKNALILRLGTAFGISDNFSRLRTDLAINAMTIDAIEKKTVSVYGGSQWRPFIHVKDIGKIIARSLNTDLTGRFNISTINSSIIDISRKIEKIYKCKTKFYNDSKLQDKRDYMVDTTKAKKGKLIKSNNMLTIEDGIKEVGEVVKSRRIKDVKLINYSNEKYLTQNINDY